MNKGIVEIFRGIEDPRKGNGIRHKLEEVLTIAILAVLCECTQFTEMELFGIEREEWLRTFLTLENGIPSHDTFGDVFAALNPETVHRCFIEWVETIRNRISGEVIAVDGKTVRRSKDMPRNKRAIHVVSAWASENGLVLGEVTVEEKSNEIKAIPELLELLYLKDCIITIDAMGTQREIAQTIIKREADYVLVVKENQRALYEDIALYFATEKAECDYIKTVEKSHGRYETRECYATTEIGWLEQKEKWCGLAGIGMVVSSRQQVNTEIVEKMVHYVIYSRKSMTAGELLASKRAHWSVENSLHWVLDMNFREDESRMRMGNSAENMNILRHLALNLIKNEKTFKGSINMKRKKCMLSIDYLLKVINYS